MSAPQLLWRNAGEPPHKYAEEPHDGVCATCAASIVVGISAEEINNPTFSNHAEFFRFGTHVCRACAWLYGIGKGRPGNVLAAGDELWWPMISGKSAREEERPAWLDTLQALRESPNEAPAAGVLTTDTKPRVWPRMRIVSIKDFGLYVHAPEYAISEYRTFDLADLLAVSGLVREALDMGFSKQRIRNGLLSDFARAKRNIKEVMRLEKQLHMLRERSEFAPALIVTCKGWIEESKSGVSGRTGGAGEASGKARQDGDGLFQL